MLGLGDWGVSLAFILMLCSTVFCAVFGFVSWNTPRLDEEAREIAEEEKSEKGEVRELWSVPE